MINIYHVVFILSLLAITNSVSSSDINKKLGSSNNANWMARSMGSIANKTLKQITLPGTHDSGSYNLTDELLGVPDYMAELVKVADFLGLPVGPLIEGWAKSQVDNLYDQFVSGIRYADIRTVWDATNNVWKTHHGVVIGGNMEVLLQNIRSFAQNYPTEVLVLELASSTTPTTSAQVQILIDLIQSYIGLYLWPTTGGFKTIGEMVQSKKTILLTMEYDNLPVNIWPGNTIINSYANSPDLTTMENYNEGIVSMFSKNGPPSGSISKMSWTLTPNEDTIIDMIIPGKPHDLIELADIANNDLDNWYQTKISPLNYQYPIFTNIFIIDHHTITDIVEICQKGLN